MLSMAVEKGMELFLLVAVHAAAARAMSRTQELAAGEVTAGEFDDDETTE
jgi:hypothetical protein